MEYPPRIDWGSFLDVLKNQERNMKNPAKKRDGSRKAT
jgi:hypothetical protein